MKGKTLYLLFRKEIPTQKLTFMAPYSKLEDTCKYLDEVEAYNKIHGFKTNRLHKGTIDDQLKVSGGNVKKDLLYYINARTIL